MSRLSERATLMAAIAERVIKAGMQVVATAERSKIPDKRFCPHGLKDATSSLAVVKTWLMVDDRINLAASVQGSDICVVDVDGPKGRKALRALSELPPTRKTKTRNGSHRFYRYDGDLGGSVIKLAPDLDFILSGYVMLPGSEHPRRRPLHIQGLRQANRHASARLGQSDLQPPDQEATVGKAAA